MIEGLPTFLQPVPVILWLACGVMGYGLTFAHFQRKWAYWAKRDLYFDFGFSIWIGITGPIGLVLALFMTSCGKYGLKFIPRLDRPESAGQWE